MKEAEQHPARESNVIGASQVVNVSIDDPIPPALVRRFGESMGLYDQPEHTFRMYATVALG